jgi:hypothetical protein
MFSITAKSSNEIAAKRKGTSFGNFAFFSGFLNSSQIKKIIRPGGPSHRE